MLRAAGRCEIGHARGRGARPRVAMTVDVMPWPPSVDNRPAHLAISASRPCRIPAFTTRRRSSLKKSSASISRIASQSRAAKCVLVALGHLACRVFQPRCRPAELLESRDRGVDGCLVEDFAAVDHVAFDRENADHPPLGVETLLRGLIRHVWSRPLRGCPAGAPPRRSGSGQT